MDEMTGAEFAGQNALFGMTREELAWLMEDLGQPKYRAVQLGDALYKQRVGSLEEMTTLPVGLREAMAKPTSRYSSHLEGLRVEEFQHALGSVGAEAGRHCVAFIGV